MVVHTGRGAKVKAVGFLEGVGPGDVAIPLFIFTTFALDEGNVLNSVSRVILVGVFVLDLLSGKKVTLNPFLVAAGIFLALSAISLSWTVAPGISAARVQTFVFQFVAYLALLNLISWKHRRLQSSFTWVILGALVAGVYVVVIQGVSFQEARSVAGVIPPGQLALSCAAGIAISIYRFAKNRQYRYLAVIVALSVFLAATSGRRGFLITTFFLIAFLFLSAEGFGRKIGSLLGGAAVLGGAYALTFYNPYFYNAVGYRLESFVGFISGDASGDASVQGRSGLIDFGLKLFQEAPLVGHGIDSFRAQFQFRQGSWDTSADNNYVELLADLGIVGFLAYYIPLAIFLVRGLHGIGSKTLEVRFAVAFVMAMAVVDFSTVWVFSKVGMLMMALCYMVVYQDRSANREVGYSAVGARDQA